MVRPTLRYATVQTIISFKTVYDSKIKKIFIQKKATNITICCLFLKNIKRFKFPKNTNMPAVDNIIVVIDGITYDTQEIMRKIVVKYGENPIISDYAKKRLLTTKNVN